MRRAALLALWASSLAPVVLFTAPAPADVVFLKDGGKIEGEIIRKTSEGWVIRTADGATTTIDAGKVKSFEARRSGTGSATGNGGNGEGSSTRSIDEPMQGLISLRRSVESQTDIPKIVERYRKFIDANLGTPAADEALKELEMWERRVEQQMVKVGDRWVTPEEKDALHAQAGERAAAARKLIVAGRLKEAASEIDGALAQDAHNAAALYLRGVLLYRQDQTANARKSFEASLQESPNHGPTLNNIAVIMWGAKQFPGALNYYGQAMNSAPGTRQILDNVAEALNDLPKDQRDNDVTKKAVLLFNTQDMAMQVRLKKRGMFRWGSTWVSEKDLKQLEAEEQRVEDRIAKLEEEFEDVQDRLAQIERDVGDTERSIRRIEASSYGRDATGRPVRLSYPKLYYDLKRDLDALYDERDVEREKTSRLRKKARQVKQEISVPPYAGVQQIIGVEGAPDLPSLDADAPALRSPDEEPTSAPAKAREQEADARAK